MTRCLVISAPASGTGKTTLTLALARAFRERGLAVQCFKSGPDYIDPAFHTAATGRASVNIDSWAMPRDTVEKLVSRAQDADLVLAEGSMGLFDGVATPGMSGTGASADLAEMMGWPVLLVLDPAGQAQTAAAVAVGLRDFRKGVRIAGVVLNRVASSRHEDLVRRAMDGAGIAVVGALPRHAPIALPERHLGLVQAEELSRLNELISEAARLVAERIDLDAVLRLAECGWTATDNKAPARVTPPGQRIALARDAAFSFIYPHILEGWRAAGSEVLPFSPLADEGPDDSADVGWLPGGYPELHAGQIAANRNFRQALKAFAETRPVHGECGGYIVLGEGLTDAKGARHEMTGLLGLETSFAKRRMHLGYRRAELTASMPGHAQGIRLRGHEFHYASIAAQPDPPLASVRDANGAEVAETGSHRGHVTGTFFHLIAEER
ncbi:cobyrinate a,c-diamide synthase [Bradyrhizobium genosp. P]|uniref:cobyrinate a,c-diamide synthase n=1 Tax=Bradyrhizobium genosp. P TaxID=83641 RepID=UPI003CE7F161